MTDLKPCPFCGSSDVWFDVDRYARPSPEKWCAVVGCSSCRARLAFTAPDCEPALSGMASAWNRRAPDWGGARRCGTCRHWSGATVRGYCLLDEDVTDNKTSAEWFCAGWEKRDE